MLFDRTKAATGRPAPDLEAQARHHRDRMAGMWAAELLGLIGHAAQDYARELAHPHDADAHADDEQVISRLCRDLRGKAGPTEIRRKLAHLLHEARRQLMSEGKRR
ncbi:MAG TPA: ATPase inhibitor subunit zeta [Magnetospirillum sp.]|nr:ATPase inhibitor subunit zeta [Magnetospirillum sp.]